MDNMKVWNAVKQPPTEALKEIAGGRLKGKTDINPQWRYQVMTEQFGMCGVGWMYDVRVWNEPTVFDQVFAFAEVNLYIKQGEEWSDPIPGIGGSMLVTKEKEGLHASDEGYKMAITDALSVAMKMLGVGANIYAGLSASKNQTAKTKAPARKPTTKKKEFDTTTIEGALEFLEDKYPEAWGHLVVAAKIRKSYEVTGDTMEKLIANLSREQKEKFSTIVSQAVMKANEKK